MPPDLVTMIDNWNIAATTKQSLKIAAALIFVLSILTADFTRVDKLESASQQKNKTITLTPRDLLNRHDCLKPFSQPIVGVNDHKRILVMGMPKCGTTSLKYMFQKSLGKKKVSHWRCDAKDEDEIFCGKCMRAAVKMNDDIGILRACGDFQVFAQMDWYGKVTGTCIFPQMVYMDRLYQDSPNATWIMQFRNTTDWLRSVMNWGPPTLKLGMRFEKKCGWEEFSPVNKTKMKQEAEVAQFICNHVKSVRQFVTDHPSLSLIEFDIYDEKAGEYLADTFLFLNASLWERQNKSKNLRERRNTSKNSTISY